MLGGYKFGNNWEVSSRYRYLGKFPYPPVNQQATLDNYPAIIRDYTLLGTVELDPLSQLDVRIDKKWSFDKFSLDLFLEIKNTLLQKNPSQPSYGLGRDANGNIITPRSLVRVDGDDDASVLPSIGLVLNF